MIDHGTTCAGAPCTCDVQAIVPKEGDTIKVKGVVIARNTFAGWVNVRLDNGNIVAIAIDRTTKPHKHKHKRK